jgi:hypothetical protein
MTDLLSSLSGALVVMPANTALAALVPWALEGIKQTVRWVSPRDRW